MNIPDFPVVMASVLQMADTEKNYKQAVQILKDKFNLTDEEVSETVKSNKRMTVIKNRVAWSVSYLYQAGLLSRPRRGYFLITPQGEEARKMNLESINTRFLMNYPSFVEFRHKRSKSSDSVDSGDSDEVTLPPEERMESAYREITTELQSDLLNRILGQSPEFFEQLVVDLLRAMGYGGDDNLAKAIGKSGDGGVDGVIHQDSLGLDVVYMQAKRYAPDNTVGRPDLQKFIGSLSGFSANKGVFITTSSFSSNVNEYLNSVQQRVVVVDGNQLVKLMIKYGVGVRIERAYTLHRIDEDFFSVDLE